MSNNRPNVIYILGDDHRSELLGCLGHPILRTPNLDRLASDGARFDNAFCTSPACTPSRACHYLGQWERTHGVNFNSDSAVAEEAWAQSFPARLVQEGYYLGWVGKNHVPMGQGGYKSGAMERAFDYWYGNHNHSGFYPKEQAGRGKEVYQRAAMDTQVEVFAEGAMNFLKPQRSFLESAPTPLPKRPEDRPFCLCVTFNLPHSFGAGHMQLRPSDDELYKSAYRDRFNDVPLPENYVPYERVDPSRPRLPRSLYSGLQISSYDYVREPRALRERLIREYQTITGVDRFVGQLRQTLDDLGLAENTIIVFSTDHGIHKGEHGLGGKCFLYEQDLRIPLIVYDPRLPQAQRGQVRKECVAVPDLAPTVLELCGLQPTKPMQGRSLKPLIEGQIVANWRNELFTEQLMDIQNYPRSQSVRNERWKYIAYFQRTEDPAQSNSLFRGTLDDYNTCLGSMLHEERPVYEELFDLEHDPGETTNLVDHASASVELDRLRLRCLDLGREIHGAGAPPATVSL